MVLTALDGLAFIAAAVALLYPSSGAAAHCCNLLFRIHESIDWFPALAKDTTTWPQI
jgi:hypothetical protein